jgi:peptide chain release factor 2
MKTQASASAWIFPEVDDNIEIEIADKDLRVDTYRASGWAGSPSARPTARCASPTSRPASPWLPSSVVPTEAERSEAQRRDLFSAIGR